MAGGGLAAVQRRGLAAMWGAAVSVYRSQRVAGFYTGYVPNILQARLRGQGCQWHALASRGPWRPNSSKLSLLMQVLPNAAISYAAYSYFKEVLAGKSA